MFECRLNVSKHHTCLNIHINDDDDDFDEDDDDDDEDDDDDGESDYVFYHPTWIYKLRG